MSKPVIYDFYADWCRPCKNMMPLWDKVAEEFKDKADFVKVNVETDKEKVKELGIKSVPTIMFTSVSESNKSNTCFSSGAKTYDELKKLVEGYIEMTPYMP